MDTVAAYDDVLAQERYVRWYQNPAHYARVRESLVEMPTRAGRISRSQYPGGNATLIVGAAELAKEYRADRYLRRVWWVRLDDPDGGPPSGSDGDGTIILTGSIAVGRPARRAEVEEKRVRDTAESAIRRNDAERGRSIAYAH